MKSLLAIFGLVGVLATAQERSIAFEDENRPRMLRMELLDGNVVVRGHGGKEAIITSPTLSSPERMTMRISESNNTLSISGANRGTLVVQVPFETSVYVRCANCNEVLVDNVRGDLDVNSINGGIRFLNVSGSVLAHSLNKNIQAVISKLDPDKPSSFTTMNGSVDCTFPSDLKANVKMRTENGKIHTDFDIRLGGGLPIRTDRGISGTIGGGGPDLQMRAYNGSIFIRKK